MNLEALSVPTVLGEKAERTLVQAKSRHKFTERELYIPLAHQSRGKIPGSWGLGFSCHRAASTRYKLTWNDSHPLSCSFPGQTNETWHTPQSPASSNAHEPNRNQCFYEVNNP